jgi:hypothetical protein
LPIVVAKRSWIEISLRKNRERQIERKRAYKEEKKAKDPNNRAQPPISGDCGQVLAPNFHRKMGAEVDYQVAAPTELGTPTMHRAKIAQPRVRMEGWRQRRPDSNARNSQKGRVNRKKKHPYRERRRKTSLTLTGLLMEGVEQYEREGIISLRGRRDMRA